MAFAAMSLVSSLGLGVESSAGSTFAWPAYHSNTELYAEWQKLADSSYCKDKMSLVNEDESVDGWKIKTATFGTGDTKVMYVFGIHGREYLGAEVGLALMKRLCNEEGDSRIDELLKKVTFKMFPLMNPSGRAGNLPEKKISSNHGEECVLRRTNANGIDLNRNFDVHFSDGDSMPGAVDWRGEKPLSEVESKLLAKIGASFKPDLYIDVHTGAFATLAPYSYTTQDIPKDDMSALMNLLMAVKVGGGGGGGPPPPPRLPLPRRNGTHHCIASPLPRAGQQELHLHLSTRCGPRLAAPLRGHGHHHGLLLRGARHPLCLHLGDVRPGARGDGAQIPRRDAARRDARRRLEQTVVGPRHAADARIQAAAADAPRQLDRVDTAAASQGGG